MVCRKKQTKQELLNKLHSLSKKGVDVSATALRIKGNPQRYLYSKLKRLYPKGCSWQTILDNARLNYTKIMRRKPQRGAYSKREIVLKVIELYNHNHTLNRTDLLNNKEYNGYVQAAGRLFENGWIDAVTITGIDYNQFRKRKPNGYWSQQKIIEEIRLLKENGESLNPASMLQHHRDIHQAAFKHFENWKAALEACNIDPDEEYVPSKSLSKKTIKRKDQRTF